MGGAFINTDLKKDKLTLSKSEKETLRMRGQ